MSGSAPQTASAASYVQPPAKTDSRAEERLLLGSSSRSYDHSIVARSVCWRGSASRPALSRSRRCDRRSRSCSGENTTVRAAASSSASGRLSSRAQSSRDGVRAARPPSASALRAREEELDTVARAERRHRIHVLALELQALAARDEERRAGDVAERVRSRVRRPGIRCSALSSSSEHRLPARRAATLSASSLPGLLLDRERLCERTTSRGAHPAATPAAPTRCRPGYDSAASAAACIASRVLPVPPGPVSVSSRVPSASNAHDLRQLVLAAEERRRRHRQIRAIEALERREVAVPELEDPLGCREVLEAVLAEVAQ